MSTRSSTAQVVIYGGGIAGALLAKKLSPTFRVTLVDPNEYFEVPMAAPRNLVRPEFSDQAIISFAEALPKVNHIRGSLIELQPSDGVVQLPDGRKQLVSGQVTVLATGSAFSNSLMRAIGGASVNERKAFYDRYQKRIATSDRILIVGGGPIGVEVAGEITENFPMKSVTLLEGGARLLAGTSEAAAAHALKVLTGKGIKILLNEKLKRADGVIDDIFAPAGEAHTERGRAIPYDLLIWAIGGKPNTSYMKQHYSIVLNAAGRIRVTPELRVVGTSTLFALGDITDLDENKMAWHIDGQVKTAAHNIRVLLAGSNSGGSLRAHKPKTGNPMMAVTLGSQNGVLHLPMVGVIRSAGFARMAKAGHMLVPKYRKALGV